LGLEPEWFASLLAISAGAVLAGRAAFLRSRIRALIRRDELPNVDAQVKGVELIQIAAQPAAKLRFHIDCWIDHEPIALDFIIEAPDVEAARSSERYLILRQTFRVGETITLRAWRRLGATEYFADAGVYALNQSNGRGIQTTLNALMVGGAMFILVGIAFFWIDL
jgi:hypothetical protein